MKLVCKTVFGSHLYGTSTPTSDIDVRGVFVPSKKDILLGRIPRTSRDQGQATDDFELYSLHHFVKLAIEGQTVAFDMLWTPASQTTLGEGGYIWTNLVALRDKFISKRMNSFIGYARGQAAKYSMKGERLSKLEAFLDILKPAYSHFLLADYFDQLPKDDVRVNSSRFRELQIAGKWYGERTEIHYVRESVQNIIDAYGKRAQASREGVDWKAMSHAVRVSLELQDLLIDGEVEFPLHYADLLLRIKQGEESLENVQACLDQVLASIEELAANSNWPEEVDRVFWDNWLEEVVEHEIRNG